MKKQKYIKLFANCVIVKGATRSLICDLQRSKYKLIPNSLAELFDDNNVISILEINENFEKDDMEIFNEYMELLNENELIFYCSKKEINKFPLLSLEWDYPAHISNIIIDIDSGSNHNYEKIIKQDLALLNCRYIQFRRFDESTIIEWEAIMQIINQSPVRAVDILIKDSSKNFTFSQLSDFVRKNRKIRSVTIHSATENKVLQEQTAGFSVVVAIQQKIDATNHCGVINPSYFITNIETFTESQKYNTCLNRKISVDRNGDIKNCPSMVESFGNIKDTTLEEALNKTTFKKLCLSALTPNYFVSL